MSKQDRKTIFLKIKYKLWLGLIILSVAILAISFLSKLGPDITSFTATRLENTLQKRLSKLEAYMRQVLENNDEWPELKNFPSDMVVYCYENDSLKSWKNQFTLDNDDISHRIYRQCVSNLRFNLVSPLSQVDTVANYLNIGPRWYLTECLEDGKGCKVIGGLMVKNSTDGSSYNGINHRLRISDRFSIYPVSYTGGATVSVKGRPLIKIIQENAHVMAVWPNSWSVWISLFLALSGVILFVSRRKSRGRMWIAMAMNSVICALFFLLGYGMRSQTDLFSPNVYADGGMLYSLGAVLIINLWITANVTCLYTTRYCWLRFMESGKQRFHTILYTALIGTLFILVALYTHLSFRSLIINSNLNLELYQVANLSRHTLYVYISYISLILVIAVLLQMLSPVLRAWAGLRYDIFSRSGRMVVAIVGAVYLLSMSSILSFSREEGRAEIWANRLSIDRNLSFEIQLRSMENSIATDGMIPTLIALNRDFKVIVSRISETYLNRIASDYDVNMYMFRDTDADEDLVRYFNDRMRNGIPLADNSRFQYSRSAVGRAQYTGIFTYYNRDKGLVRLLIALENKAADEGRGYDVIMDENRSGSVSLPSLYSYGKYYDDKLVGYRGDFAYPTVFSGRLENASDSVATVHVSMDKYVHFITPISDNEYIVISRKTNDVTKYLVAGFLLLLVIFTGSWIMNIGRRKSRLFENNYYMERLHYVLSFSLFATLVSMSLVSVLFIYKLNRANITDLMAGKINTIQSLVEAQGRYFRNSAQFSTVEFANELENISNYTKSDISLYTTDGKILSSTFPEIFDNLTIGTRLNGEAYRSLIHDHKRYFIHKEKIGRHSVYSMSAPIFDSEGKMQVIVNSPYTDAEISFRDDAMFHACFIIVVFFMLLFLTRRFSTAVVNKMFHPLVDMGRKMKKAKISGLEYIFYERDDEIATLVDSYNRMVHDLSESSKQAAQIERDKAWSEMARQVAHEIKNPLTPIKLKIQQLIRMKSRNDPAWQSKFDSTVPVIMESIDQLTDTANEFSTFAKLYSEEAVEINLDRLASDEIALFDEKENIGFQYIGLQNAVVKGPKPQLTRVFVNLLTNSVQAIEGMQRELADTGKEYGPGKIFLSIRNSSREGFYEIVFEDNGPGVKDENRSKLFTPNFTTKSSGTGLGLAICKNILDLCGGEIFYSKSFTLGGACFTIRYPKAPVS